MRVIFAIITSLFITLSSCNLINPEEEIPSYLSVKNSTVITDELTQGANTSNICDVWVNIDGNKQGNYELPVTFPVLASGKHKITFKPGIKINGIAASRVVYPFLNNIDKEIDLKEDSVYSFNPVYSYKSETVFSLNENFEDAGFSFKRNILCDTTLFTESDPNGSGNLMGTFVLDNIKTRFFYESTDSFLVNAAYTPVYIELDYNIEDYLSVGVKLIQSQYSTYESYITLYPTEGKTNKVYINLTDFLKSNLDIYAFGIFFKATKTNTTTTAKYRIDNVKLVHF